MFTRFSIRQLLFATAGIAVVVSVVATGIEQENLMGWGVVISVAILPLLFLAHGAVILLAQLLCRMGIALLGPLESTAAPAVTTKKTAEESVPMEQTSLKQRSSTHPPEVGSEHEA